MENQDLVSVHTVQNATEAEIIRGALESVGISCTIGGEGQAGFAGFFEINVLTPVEDADRARKYLRQLRREKKERKKERIEKRKTKAAEPNSEAIQEMKPPLPPSSDIQKSEPEA